MDINFVQKVIAHLSAPVAIGGTQIAIPDNEYGQIMSAPGDVYLMIRGPVDRELVKVDLSTSLWGNYITIARGQGGTIARAWPRGSMLFATTHADHYNSIIQAGASRVIDYNPNQVLAPLYAGEKIYQSAPVSRWWKSFNGVDSYWDLITGDPTADEGYVDIGWTYPILIAVAAWESHFDNDDFYSEGATYAVWNAGGWWDSVNAPSFDQQVQIKAQGAWYTGYRPEKFRITIPDPGHFMGYVELTIAFTSQTVVQKSWIYVEPGQDFILESNISPTNYTNWGNIEGVRVISNNGNNLPWKLTNIEWYVGA